MDTKIMQLREMISKSRNIVFFGGAGVSTESGVPDFRSVDGLYRQKYKYNPETIISGSFFRENPEEFYRYYHDKLSLGDVKPNACHHRLAELEAEGRLVAVITQNIDGLHQAAGSKNVLELHGTIHRCHCSNCGKEVDPALVNDCPGVPYCECGGVLRPDVVLYEEPLNGTVYSEAIEAISQCDMLIVGGTSLMVQPAAGLLRYYKGRKLVLINRDATPYDDYAAVCIHANLGEIFSQV